MEGSAYKKAGVDVAMGEALVEAIKPCVAATQRSGVMGGIGGFGALFDPRAAGYKDPILVSGTDGVGTKLKIAIAMGDHTGVGQDLVAMCANDIIVQGAEPLFFLDYFASGALEASVVQAVIASIAKGCQAAGCALIGGEMAEMPGLYAKGDYDLAGFCVGAVERQEVIKEGMVQKGDVLLGLASDGVHSNGFSLMRKIVEEGEHDYVAPAPWNKSNLTLSPPLQRGGQGGGHAPENPSLGAALLTPTRLYVKPILEALRREKGAIHGMAHITGGGILGNVRRIVPDGLCASIDQGSWPRPPVFDWLMEAGGVSTRDAFSTWNMGLGMVLAVESACVSSVINLLTKCGEKVYEIGHIQTGKERVRL